EAKPAQHALGITGPIARCAGQNCYLRRSQSWLTCWDTRTSPCHQYRCTGHSTLQPSDRQTSSDSPSTAKLIVTNGSRSQIKEVPHSSGFTASFALISLSFVHRSVPYVDRSARSHALWRVGAVPVSVGDAMLRALLNLARGVPKTRRLQEGCFREMGCVRVALRHRLSDRVHALDAENSVALRAVVTRVAYAHGADSEKPSIHADNVDAVCRAASLERHAPSVITAANLVFHVADVAKRES